MGGKFGEPGDRGITWSFTVDWHRVVGPQAPPSCNVEVYWDQGTMTVNHFNFTVLRRYFLELAASIGEGGVK